MRTLSLISTALLCYSLLNVSTQAASKPKTPKDASVLRCQTVRYSDGGVARYGCKGSYSYRNGGAYNTGRYTIRGSRVCVKFDGGGSRCDTVRGNVLTNSR